MLRSCRPSVFLVSVNVTENLPFVDTKIVFYFLYGRLSFHQGKRHRSPPKGRRYMSG